jgi:hypothetical protein
MSVSAIGSAHAPTTAPIPAPPQATRAPDGDSPAVEAAESAASKQAEKANGGIAPKAAAPGGVNKLV